MYSALSFIIIFCILYYFIYLIIKKINPNLGIGDTINLGLLLIAVITISVTIYSFNGWKSQHYLNNKEKLLTQISDQLEKTNNQVQTTQRLLSYFINDSKLTSREAIFDAYYSTGFEINKLLYLLVKASNQIESECTKLQISGLTTFKNSLQDQIITYSKVETTLYNTVDNPYNKLSSQELKLAKLNLINTHAELNLNWRGLSDILLSSTIKLSGDINLEQQINPNKKCELDDFFMVKK